MQWDIFCRVIDNFGDIGVCWRLACDLTRRGHGVRLWADDTAALAWLAPADERGPAVIPWRDPLPVLEPGDVVIEAFGCELPAPVIERMRRPSRRPPVWINLEHLSAEDYVERSHGLPSPQPSGLTKFFFYPGFTERTGGLLREPGLVSAQASFDRSAWLHTLGLRPALGTQVITLFCYDNPALPDWLDAQTAHATLVLVTPGPATRQVAAWLGCTPEAGMQASRGALTAAFLPFLSQDAYDRLLWAGDLNFVRGEDSFVRAQWAGKPFVWQIYPQHDGVHAHKLNAFLDRFLADAPPSLAGSLRAAWLHWNGLSAQPPPEVEPAAWHRLVKAWRARLLGQSDLTTQLLGFVMKKR